MPTIKTVGIKDLKNNLSAYLRDVRQGTRILVTDRNTVAAELHEPGASYQISGNLDPVLASWIETGLVVPAAARKTPLPISPVEMEEGAALRLLEEDRTEEHA
jgi:KaiC/GvpD/RAD55 family RecA-like ATPase